MTGTNLMTFGQEADLMARVLQDDIVFRFQSNFCMSPHHIKLLVEFSKYSILKQRVYLFHNNFNLSGSGFSLFCLNYLTQILIFSLEWWDLKSPLKILVSNLQVGDGTDGKLVHLDGLNFSRAWGLYRIASRLGGEEGER